VRTASIIRDHHQSFYTAVYARRQLRTTKCKLNIQNKEIPYEFNNTEYSYFDHCKHDMTLRDMPEDITATSA
jgi:hypothetical protein